MQSTNGISNFRVVDNAHQIVALKKLLPISREGIEGFQNLAMYFSAPGWRELFTRLWQQQVKCLAEVEWKIRELGGEIDTPASSKSRPNDSEDEPVDPLSRDKRMLLNCINQQTHLLYVFTEARKNPLSFDVQMILQRHQIIAQEVMERLSSFSLTYPARLSVRWDQALAS